MVIRKSVKREITALGAFYDRVVRALYKDENYPKWTYKEYPSHPYVKAMADKGALFACLADGEIAAAFVLNDDPQGQYENVAWSKPLARGEYMVLHAFAVDPDMQRRGIGKQVVKYCLSYAKENGYKAVRLDTVPTNIPSRKLYEKCGFSYRGDVDLGRNLTEIPVFSMYEFNL